MINLLSQYQVLIIPIASAALSQVIKFFIKSNHEKFNLKILTAYSGMPSGHSALVVSLSAIIGLHEGWDSPLFAAALVLAIIVIRDALGIRRYLGEHGHVLNILLEDLKNDRVLEQKYPHLLERIGHTPLQALAGSLIGLSVSLAGFWLLN
jgi:hypothetical protein